jgi:hypothetical protein
MEVNNPYHGKGPLKGALEGLLPQASLYEYIDADSLNPLFCDCVHNNQVFESEIVSLC